MYISDAGRVERAIIPALLESYLLPHVRSCFRKRNAALVLSLKAFNFAVMYDIYSIHNERFKGFVPAASALNTEFHKQCGGNRKVMNRTNKLANKILGYTTSQGFNNRKRILTTTHWLNALDAAGAAHPIDNVAYFEALDAFGQLIKQGYATVDGFDKADASAAKHVPAFHKIAQDAGIFI